MGGGGSSVALPPIKIKVPGLFEFSFGVSNPPRSSGGLPPVAPPAPVPRPEFSFSPEFKACPALLYFTVEIPSSQWFFSQEKQCKIFALNRFFQISSDKNLVLRKKNFMSINPLQPGFAGPSGAVSSSVLYYENKNTFLQNYLKMNTVTNIKYYAQLPRPTLAAAAASPREKLAEIVTRFKIDPILALIYTYLNPSDFTTQFFWGFENYLAFANMSSVSESQKLVDFGAIEILVIKWVISYRDEILSILGMEKEPLFGSMADLFPVFLYAVNNTAHLEPLLRDKKGYQTQLFYSFKVREFVKQMFATDGGQKWPPIFTFYDDSGVFNVNDGDFFNLFFQKNPIVTKSDAVNVSEMLIQSLVVPARIGVWEADSPEFISFNGKELTIKSAKQKSANYFFNFNPVLLIFGAKSAEKVHVFYDTNHDLAATQKSYVMCKNKRVDLSFFGQVQIATVADLPIASIEFFFTLPTRVNGGKDSVLYYLWENIPAKPVLVSSKSAPLAYTKYSISNSSIVPNMISDQKLFYFSPWSLVFSKLPYALDYFLFYSSKESTYYENDDMSRVLKCILVYPDFSYAYQKEHFGVSRESSKKETVSALVFPADMLVQRFAVDNQFTLSNRMSTNKKICRVSGFRFAPKIAQTYSAKDSNDLKITMVSSMALAPPGAATLPVAPIGLNINVRYFDMLTPQKEFDNLLYEFKNVMNGFYQEEENRRLFLTNDQDGNKVSIAMPDDLNFSPMDNALLCMAQDFVVAESQLPLMNGYTTKYKVKDYSFFFTGICSKCVVSDLQLIYGLPSRTISNSYDTYMSLNRWGRLRFSIELFLSSHVMQPERTSEVTMFDFLLELNTVTGEILNVTNFRDNFNSPKQPFFDGTKLRIDYDRTFTKETKYSPDINSVHVLCLSFFKKNPFQANISLPGTTILPQLLLHELKIIFDK